MIKNANVCPSCGADITPPKGRKMSPSAKRLKHKTVKCEHCGAWCGGIVIPSKKKQPK